MRNYSNFLTPSSMLNEVKHFIHVIIKEIVYFVAWCASHFISFVNDVPPGNNDYYVDITLNLFNLNICVVLIFICLNKSSLNLWIFWIMQIQYIYIQCHVYNMLFFSQPKFQYFLPIATLYNYIVFERRVLSFQVNYLFLQNIL